MTMFFSAQIEMMGVGPRGRGSSVSVGESAVLGSGASPAGGGAGQRPVLQFLTKLRRHASLEGASPYFKIKKWKLDSSQRASSLDTRGNGWYFCDILFLEKSVPVQQGSTNSSSWFSVYKTILLGFYFFGLFVCEVFVPAFSLGKHTMVKQQALATNCELPFD